MPRGGWRVVLGPADEQAVADGEVHLAGPEEVVRREVVLERRVLHRDGMGYPIERVLLGIVDRRVVDQLVVPRQSVHAERLVAADEEAGGGLRIRELGEGFDRREIAPT